MNHTLKNGFILAMVGGALAGGVSLADDLPSKVQGDSPKIVLAQTPVGNAVDKSVASPNPAVEQALQRIREDNRTELDLRLSVHKSGFLVASR